MFLANFELFWKKIQSVPCQHQYCLLTQRLHMLMHRAEFHLLYRVSQTIRKKKRDKTHLLVVFFGCQYNKTDHKCWLYDSQYDFSGIFSYNAQYETLIGNNAKSIKFSYCYNVNGTSGHRQIDAPQKAVIKKNMFSNKLSC